MNHGKKILKIGRNASHRKATLESMSAALLEHKRITTTFGKAKALRRFVEPVITRSKDDSTHGRRQAFRRLGNKEAVKTLYNEVAPAVGDRPGGYTRIVKLGQRDGDAAEMAIVELVDFNDVRPEGGAGSKRKTRRSGRSRRSRGNNAAPTVPAAEAKAREAEAQAAPPADAPAGAPESQEAEAVASNAANPVETGNPQVPQSGDHPDHGDAEQGAAPGTGEPPPEAGAENQGRSGDHR
ncbi:MULTISPECIES: 50S ribosomal protein L17 [Rubrivirga]|uniref:50S ribosomal protein L17 n=1 Tax=Rubrivirga TaxID=1434037 RepID=UPI0032C2301C